MIRRPFSRWMPLNPPAPPMTPWGQRGWCIATVLLAALIAGAVQWSEFVAVCFGALLFPLMAGKFAEDGELAVERADESYASFWPRVTWSECFLVAGLLTALIATLIARPYFVSAILMLVLVGSLVIGCFANQNARQLALERAGEDIGTFARAFDRRNEPFDPWVVRATWDSLRPYCNCPLRPADRLEELGIDGLELEELFAEIAKRSGHSLEDSRIVERIETVGEFVRVIAAQPQLLSHQPEAQARIANGNASSKGRP
jgi:acyl carrier protein